VVKRSSCCFQKVSQKRHSQQKRLTVVSRKPLISLVAGRGFEPLTFGLWVWILPIISIWWIWLIFQAFPLISGSYSNFLNDSKEFNGFNAFNQKQQKWHKNDTKNFQ
jgi:hypothetical protein